MVRPIVPPSSRFDSRDIRHIGHCARRDSVTKSKTNVTSTPVHFIDQRYADAARKSAYMQLLNIR